MNKAWPSQESIFLYESYLKLLREHPFKKLKIMLQLKYGIKEYFNNKSIKNRIRYQFFKAIRMWKKLFKPKTPQEYISVSNIKQTYLNAMNYAAFPAYDQEMGEAHCHLLTISINLLKKKSQVDQQDLRKIFNLLMFNHPKIQQAAKMRKQNQNTNNKPPFSYKRKISKQLQMQNQDKEERLIYQSQLSAEEDSLSIFQDKKSQSQKNSNLQHKDDFEEGEVQQQKPKKQLKKQKQMDIEFQSQEKQQSAFQKKQQKKQAQNKEEQQQIKQKQQINMQSKLNKDFKTFCKNGFRAFLLCKEENCFSNALMCYHQINNCQKCLNNHKKCRNFIKISSFLQGCLQKKTDVNLKNKKIITNKVDNFIKKCHQNTNALEKLWKQIKNNNPASKNQNQIQEFLSTGNAKYKTLLNVSKNNEMDINKQHANLKRKNMIQNFENLKNNLLKEITTFCEQFDKNKL